MQREGSEVELPFIGLCRERRRVAEAVRRREPLALIGPAGSGKTRLLRFALELSKASGVYLPFNPVFHDLLVSFARVLKISDAGEQTSVRLRGLIWRAVESCPRPILLDGIRGASAPVYRFFQRVYYTPGVHMLAAARDPGSLGALQKLFWDPRQTLFVPPLDDGEALALFEAAADRFALRELELDRFRVQVLDSARGSPGQIIEMCRLAAQPAYVSGRHIKFVPLRIDVMTKFLL